jgi:hypothetical protein
MTKTSLVVGIFGIAVAAMAPGCGSAVDDSSDVGSAGAAGSATNDAGARSVSVPGWELDETNTGLAGVGLRCDELEPYDGSPEPASGTTIYRKRIEMALYLHAGDITIDQSCIRPTSATMGRGLPIVMNYDRDTSSPLATSITIRDSDLDASQVDQADIGWSAAFAGSGVIERCQIWGAGSGIWLRGVAPVENRVEGNYVYGLRATPPDSHQDGLTIRDYAGPSTIVRNNRIDSTSESETGPLFIQAGMGFIDNLRIEGNLLEGNNWKLQLEASDYGYGAHLAAVDNRFATSGFGAAIVTGGSGWSTWQDNSMNDPSAPDNQGAPVEEPTP